MHTEQLNPYFMLVRIFQRHKLHLWLWYFCKIITLSAFNHDNYDILVAEPGFVGRDKASGGLGAALRPQISGSRPNRHQLLVTAGPRQSPWVVHGAKSSVARNILHFLGFFNDFVILLARKTSKQEPLQKLEISLPVVDDSD